MQVEPLHDRHDRSSFACGVEPLDRYFKSQAGQDLRRRVATCFVLVEGTVPLGYYTLAATSIALTNLPRNLAKRLPRYPMLPATLLGRLAVDRQHRGQRLGEHLLLDAFARVLSSEIATYAIVVDAKDDRAAAFYCAYDFRPLQPESGRLFIPMAEVAALFVR